MTDLSKLYKKVERISKRIFHSEKPQSTFVPSAQQTNSAQSTSSSSTTDPQMPHQPVLLNPPYPPVHPGFGTGFPQFSYPQHQQQIPNPPYGWALNAAALPPYPSSTASSSSASQTPSFAPLSLDTGSGNETAGSGFDHLAVHHDDNHDERDYLIPDQHEIIELRKAQSAKLEQGKQRVINEVTSLNLITNDVTELKKWFDAKYPHTLVNDAATNEEELERTVRKLEEKLKRLRAKSAKGVPPPRPPPPRSISQENSTGPWICDRCSRENNSNSYRCHHCQLPSRRFDPSEIDFCGCEYCSTAYSNTK